MQSPFFNSGRNGGICIGIGITKSHSKLRPSEMHRTSIFDVSNALNNLESFFGMSTVSVSCYRCCLCWYYELMPIYLKHDAYRTKHWAFYLSFDLIFTVFRPNDFLGKRKIKCYRWIIKSFELCKSSKWLFYICHVVCIWFGKLNDRYFSHLTELRFGVLHLVEKRMEKLIGIRRSDAFFFYSESTLVRL